jgi:hypothetical protein
MLLVSGLILCFTTASKAQFQPLAEGDQNVAISVLPVFSYLGTVFDDEPFSGLQLSSADILYRKYRSPNKAWRISGQVGFSNSSGEFDQVYENIQKSNSVNVSIATGIETRKNFDQWSMYSGWQVSVFGFGSNISYDYDEPLQPGSSRFLELSNLRFGAGAGVFLGAEYYVSDRLFFGAELRGLFNVGYDFGNRLDTESLNFDSNGQMRRLNESNINGKGYFVSLNTANIVQLRAGVRF